MRWKRFGYDGQLMDEGYWTDTWQELCTETYLCLEIWPGKWLTIYTTEHASAVIKDEPDVAPMKPIFGLDTPKPQS